MASRTDRKFRILGFGSPLVDLIAAVDDDFLAREVAGGKGGTLSVTAEEQRALISKLPEPPRMLTGGSAGNTVFALNRLGVESSLLGKLGRDDFGNLFRRRLKEIGGSDECLFFSESSATGACLVMSTPDGERTMRSHLSSSLELAESDLDEVDFSAFDIMLAEGYMAASPIFDETLDRAKAAGVKIAFDPGSFELAKAQKAHFLSVLGDYADIAFFNRDEAKSLFGDEPDAALVEDLGGLVEVAVLKVGVEGALVKKSGEAALAVPAVQVRNPLDTTAAGDMFAAGFLCGLAHGADLRTAGECGALLASQVVRVIGSELPDSVYEMVRTRYFND